MGAGARQSVHRPPRLMPRPHLRPSREEVSVADDQYPIRIPLDTV